MINANKKLWTKVGEGILNIYKNKQIQLYSFRNLNKESEIYSEKYYEEMIKSGAIFWQDHFWTTANNYCVKSDGNFRKRRLLSPTMYMYYLLIGEYINDKYTSDRRSEIDVYYGGKIKINEISDYDYKSQYNIFCDKIMNEKNNYEYCFKTDFKDFFNKIDIDILMNYIDGKINKDEKKITQKEILIIKEFLKFCGYGNMPQTENGITSAYLATEIYLEKYDNNLYEYLSKLSFIKNFKIIRYVDDLYIFFNKNESIKTNKIENILITKITDLANNIRLTINNEKTQLIVCTEMNKNCLCGMYDIEELNEKNNLAELASKESLINFINEISKIYNDTSIVIQDYYKAIDKNFKTDVIGYSSNEIYNFSLYKLEPKVFSEGDLEQILYNTIKNDIDIIQFDPIRIIKILLKSSERVIKSFLNALFNASRNNLWNSYHSICAIQYLLNTTFKHSDLLIFLKTTDNEFYSYYELFCKDEYFNFKCDNANKEKFIINIFDKSENGKKIFLSYFLYCISNYRYDNLKKAMNYRNFFDGISAHIGSYETKKKLSYKAYYSEKQLIQLYNNECNKYNTEINCICKNRNDNLIAHISGELINNESYKKIIEEDISIMKKMVEIKITKISIKK